jgi:hypothetical protein
MRRNDLIIAALSLSLSALGGACATEAVPNVPTYQDDVKPILESRCIRCHGGNGMLNDDPDHTGYFAHARPTDGFFNRLEDDCPDAEISDCHGLLFYTPAADPNRSAMFTGFIHATGDDNRMPPPPSPPLTTRQIQVLDNWLAHCAPGTGCP